MSSIESLPLMLKQLGLPSMLAHWEAQSQQAIDDRWSYPQYLASLANLEVSHRKTRRITRHIKEAKLPAGKTLDSFDFKALPSVNSAQITALSEDVSWVKRAHNLIVFGPSGIGKTHLAAAIAYRLIEQGIRARFETTTALVQQLQQAQAEYKLPAMLARLARIPVLILDDIGYVKKDADETGVLFQLIADRYETNSLIITANQAFDEWDKIFSDSAMAVAAIDRLVHHSTIINLKGESFRKRSQPTASISG